MRAHTVKQLSGGRLRKLVAHQSAYFASSYRADFTIREGSPVINIALTSLLR